MVDEDSGYSIQTPTEWFSYETPVEILVQTLLFKISKNGR